MSQRKIHLTIAAKQVLTGLLLTAPVVDKDTVRRNITIRNRLKLRAVEKFVDVLTQEKEKAGDMPLGAVRAFVGWDMLLDEDWAEYLEDNEELQKLRDVASAGPVEISSYLLEYIRDLYSEKDWNKIKIISQGQVSDGDTVASLDMQEAIVELMDEVGRALDDGSELED